MCPKTEWFLTQQLFEALIKVKHLSLTNWVIQNLLVNARDKNGALPLSQLLVP
jgi:hypothetical protein